MREFNFHPVEISMNYPCSGLLTYEGFIVENDDMESVMHWENTQIHNFIDDRFDYVSVVVESLLQMLGKEEKPDSPGRLILLIDENTEDIVEKLHENDFPCFFYPVPTEKEIKAYSKIGSMALEDFLNEPR